MSKWGGRKVARLTAIVLQTKGTICHLCLMDGADSPDHDPPRVQLLAAGVPDPDALGYLFPSHLACNVIRKDRPITDQLRHELRTKRLAMLGLSPVEVTLSPRFARRRPSFESTASPRKASLPLSPRFAPEKTGAARTESSDGR
jgi:hypothetical protein